MQMTSQSYPYLLLIYLLFLLVTKGILQWLDALICQEADCFIPYPLGIWYEHMGTNGTSFDIFDAFCRQSLKLMGWIRGSNIQSPQLQVQLKWHPCP